MFNGLCHTGTGGSLGNMGVWGWIGLILNLVFWVGLLASLAVLAVRAIRRTQVPVVSAQPTAQEILQAQYARGEITREEYKLRRKDAG